MKQCPKVILGNLWFLRYEKTEISISFTIPVTTLSTTFVRTFRAKPVSYKDSVERVHIDMSECILHCIWAEKTRYLTSSPCPRCSWGCPGLSHIRWDWRWLQYFTWQREWINFLIDHTSQKSCCFVIIQRKVLEINYQNNTTFSMPWNFKGLSIV